MQRLHERSPKGTFIQDAASWSRLVHRLYSRTSCTDSSYPLVVMVESTQDRYSNHPVPCLMIRKRWSVRFRKLLPNPLMRTGQVEVRQILIEHTLKLLLVKDQQVVEAFLSYTPQKAFADRIGSWRMNGRFKNLYATCCRHPSKTWSKFAIIITYQILRCLSKWCGFSERYALPKNRSEIVSLLRGSPSVTSVR
jgi:hypothetical protein